MHVSYKYKNEIKVQQMEGAMQNMKQSSHKLPKTFARDCLWFGLRERKKLLREFNFVDEQNLIFTRFHRL